MSYRNLEIWNLANELVDEIHLMTLIDLPKFELFETGSQIRRAIKSVKSNIVEGYGRRKYRMDYVRFLTFALASNDEVINHLETLFSTGSLTNKEKFESIKVKSEILGKKINAFTKAVRSG
jgi:four helix bundle protein